MKLKEQIKTTIGFFPLCNVRFRVSLIMKYAYFIAMSVVAFLVLLFKVKSKWENEAKNALKWY